MVYMSIHLVSGAWTCYTEFCPGENSKDWVYEYVDDDGKKFIVEDGKAVPAEQYQGQK